MNILVTGGAGFIGSNLVEALLEDSRVYLVRVLDDLSTGLIENVNEFMGHPKYEFIEGDICDRGTCRAVMQGIDMVSHQAALGSVPRSIKDPVRTNEVNIGGTLNIMKAASEEGVKRVILACSSSTYGDSQELPKVEDRIGRPLSPYAVTKATIEQYAAVFKETYDLDYIGLRYFNVFGPRQSPDNPYAAVIPIFCKAFMENKSPTINGDGLTSRDFTFIKNAVQANLLSIFTENTTAINKIYNIAFGASNTLLDMHNALIAISGLDLKPSFGPERPGDIKHSLANIDKAKSLLGYNPLYDFKSGLEITYKWYISKQKS